MPSRYLKTQVNGRTVSVHRLVAEQMVGHPLGPDVVVHHKNGDRYDNRPENLEVMTHKEHAHHHNQKHPIEKTCEVCGEIYVPHPTKRARQKTCSPDCRAKLISRTHLAKSDEDRARPPWSKLSFEIADEIRQRVANGEGHRALAREFGVHHRGVGMIVRNQIWVRRNKS